MDDTTIIKPTLTPIFKSMPMNIYDSGEGEGLNTANIKTVKTFAGYGAALLLASSCIPVLLILSILFAYKKTIHYLYYMIW